MSWQKLFFHAVFNFGPFSLPGREFLLGIHFHLSFFIQSPETARCIIKANCPSQLRLDKVLQKEMPLFSLGLHMPKLIKYVTNIFLVCDQSKTMTDLKKVSYYQSSQVTFCF